MDTTANTIFFKNGGPFGVRRKLSPDAPRGALNSPHPPPPTNFAHQHALQKIPYNRCLYCLAPLSRQGCVPGERCPKVVRRPKTPSPPAPQSFQTIKTPSAGAPKAFFLMHLGSSARSEGVFFMHLGSSACSPADLHTDIDSRTPGGGFFGAKNAHSAREVGVAGRKIPSFAQEVVDF